MTLGEILSKAVLNTCLGMGTVFVMLIAISCIIYLFRFIPQAAVRETAERETTPNPDDELAAVILAAVMAAEAPPQDEEPTDSPYIVRSIKRRK